MHCQDLLAPLLVGTIDEYMPIESPRPQKRRVEDLRTVRGGHEDDPHLGVKPVHLFQKLVQRLLALVVPPARKVPEAPCFPEGIELVDENDAGSLLLGLLEEIAHAGRSEADEHLDELGAAETEERHTALARHGFG